MFILHDAALVCSIVKIGLGQSSHMTRAELSLVFEALPDDCALQKQ